VRIPFVQVDAFADLPFAGNPAAVMPLGAWLDDAVLQRIAAENNLSETAFLVPITGSDDDGGAGPDFELRWFTPTSEVVLCGHATLASGHFVLSSDPERDSVRFLTRKAGELSVARSGDGYELALPAWAPSAKPLPAIVAGLGVPSVVETLWHPHRYALVVLEDAAAIRALAPDFRALAAEGDVLTIVTAPGDDTDIISRAFAPGGGVNEDPVTGSAHAVMVPYWAKRLGRDRFTAFQASPRGGHLTCRLAPAPAELGGDRVVLGGRCVTVIEGTFFL
jgi:PhzF family phenazine biosynthesis protein